MSDDAQEKKHLPTGKRLSELRKQGTVLRSRDLTGGMLVFTAVCLLIFNATRFKQQFLDNFKLIFTNIKNVPENPDLMIVFLKKMIIDNSMLLMPIFLFSLLVVLFAPFLFGGWNFTLEALQFKLGKLNPLDKIQKMFSPVHIALEVLKSMFKSFLILGVIIGFMYVKRDTILSLINLPTNAGITACYAILREFVIYICISLILIVASDLAYNFLHFQKQTKMTGQELKDEFKDTEGSVEVKRKIRSTQIAAFKQRLATAVPKANVIVTNPAHYAIALKYDERRDSAPIVMAKGKDEIAQQIRYLAISNAIPIYQAPPLARAIYHTTKVGKEIHPGLYMAVAIVLSYVHQLKNYQNGIGHAPHHVSDFEIPKEFIYDE